MEPLRGGVAASRDAPPLLLTTDTADNPIKPRFVPSAGETSIKNEKEGR
jgi:hypothetical protein